MISFPHFSRRSSFLFSKSPSGYSLKNPWENKATSFHEHEKEILGLRGMVPPCASESLDTKQEIAMVQLRTKSTPTEKCNYLLTIQDSDETLFNTMLSRNRRETIPLLDTPVMGSKGNHSFARYTCNGIEGKPFLC
jgi:hypothetical protein